MGMAHGVRETYPMLGQVIGFVAPEALTAISEAVVTTQRDFGDRSNRKPEGGMVRAGHQVIPGHVGVPSGMGGHQG